MTWRRRPTSASTRRYPRGTLLHTAFLVEEVGLQRYRHGAARQRGMLGSGKRWGGK